MADAEAQLYRRIKELRARARGAESTYVPAVAATPDDGSPPVPDLRTLLARAENHVDELRATAASLEQSLPERVERAVERVLDTHDSARRSTNCAISSLSSPDASTRSTATCWPSASAGWRTWNSWSNCSRQGSPPCEKTSAEARADIGSIIGSVESVVTKLDQPIQVTLERTRQGGVRDLFRPTDGPTEDSGASAPSTTSG